MDSSGTQDKSHSVLEHPWAYVLHKGAIRWAFPPFFPKASNQDSTESGTESNCKLAPPEAARRLRTRVKKWKWLWGWGISPQHRCPPTWPHTEGPVSENDIKDRAAARPEETHAQAWLQGWNNRGVNSQRSEKVIPHLSGKEQCEFLSSDIWKIKTITLQSPGSSLLVTCNHT